MNVTTLPLHAIRNTANRTPVLGPALIACSQVAEDLALRIQRQLERQSFLNAQARRAGRERGELVARCVSTGLTALVLLMWAGPWG